MAYISDLLDGNLQPQPGQISLERYIIESSYITKHLSRVIKDKALAVYHVLFYFSYYETGNSQLAIPWARVGAYIRSEQGNIIDNTTTVKRRLSDLFKYKCITVTRQRSSANVIAVHLPSDIPACRKLIEEEETKLVQFSEDDSLDYYSDLGRRLQILHRDDGRCIYCLIEIAENSFVIDHLIPMSKGGTNAKNNLVASCGPCNQRKADADADEFLLSNYRSGLITQEEFLRQKTHIEGLIERQK